MSYRMGEKSLQVTNRPGGFITCLIIMIATIVWVQWTSFHYLWRGYSFERSSSRDGYAFCDECSICS